MRRLVEEGGLLLLGEQRLLPAGEEGVVVARPVEESAAVDLEDPRGEATEKGPIVGHEDERAGPAPEEALEPLDRLDVEVVGRLVEEEEVGVGDERPREEDASLHPGGERGDIGGAVEFHPPEDPCDLTVAPPRGVVGCRRRQPRRDDGGHAAGQVGRHVLGQEGDHRPRGTGDLSTVGGQLSGQQPHEGRLPGAVAAEEADPLSRLDDTVDRVEQRRTTDGERHPAERDERHG